MLMVSMVRIEVTNLEREVGKMYAVFVIRKTSRYKLEFYPWKTNSAAFASSEDSGKPECTETDQRIR